MTPPHAAAPDMSARAERRSMAIIALLCLAGLLFDRWTNIFDLSFEDPDDALRLVQVRDLIGGQGWFDLYQHRAAMADAPMHWSRLVDAPIAALLMPLEPLLGAGLAERLVLVALPLAMLGVLAVVVARTTHLLTARRDLTVVAVGMLALSLGPLTQFKPLRIDHHGWQILLAATAVWVLLRCWDRPMRQGLIAGALMAASLVIALEGLPLTVALAAVLALRYTRGSAPAGLPAFMASLTLCGGVLTLATLGWPGAALIWCDALSPAYGAPVALVTGIVVATYPLAIRASPIVRIVILGIAGTAGAALFAGVAPQCLAGPFSALDPEVKRVWYDSILEGLPIWVQPRDLMILLPLPSILGLAGTALALRLEGRERRHLWTTLLALQVASFALSLVVMRAMGIAHVLALPGCAYLFLNAFRAATTRSMSAARVGLGVGSVFLTPIGAEAAAAWLLLAAPSNEEITYSEDRTVCTTPAALRGLDALPSAVLFTPIDIGSHILAYTHHSVVATGHHRNHAGMMAVVTGLPGSIDGAIIKATPATYLAFCPAENEVDKYVRMNHHSLMAALVAGRPPAWLQRVPMRPGERIQVYRILRDQPGTKSSATPFMQ